MEGSLNIKSQSSDVLATGSFITFGNEESSLCLEYQNEHITIHLKFVDEEGKNSDSDRRKEFDVLGDQEARFTFYNYKTGLGAFVLQPMDLGSIGNRKLYFQYKIDDLHNSPSKLVFYTFHLGSEVNNGEN
ncbi:DUF6864 domain-containing function [Pseudoalteromonas ulvae]|uniref:Uncharacterized protein n=1 Tax=Pseudoalteromonas ulvae TaxID=107327 RepID=A0A244CU86_PSEDV|nr:hypothetical protein [Pseudoalteromonas ulvae]OUL58799.1 hypothetical protein B1199_00485 [Pseudoalteromonas ulvae]